MNGKNRNIKGAKLAAEDTYTSPNNFYMQELERSGVKAQIFTNLEKVESRASMKTLNKDPIKYKLPGSNHRACGPRADVDRIACSPPYLLQPPWGLGLLIREAWLAPTPLPPALALLKCVWGRALGRKEIPHMIQLNPPVLSSSSGTLQ